MAVYVSKSDIEALIKELKKIATDNDTVKKNIDSAIKEIEKQSYDAKDDQLAKLKNIKKKLDEQVSTANEMVKIFQDTQNGFFTIDNNFKKKAAEVVAVAGGLLAVNNWKVVPSISLWDEKTESKEVINETIPISNTGETLPSQDGAKFPTGINAEEMFNNRKIKGNNVDATQYGDANHTITVLNSAGKELKWQKGGGCTWYAAARYEDVNGEKLVFKTGLANARDWDTAIDTTKFDVTSTSDLSAIVPNSIAVHDKVTTGLGIKYDGQDAGEFWGQTLGDNHVVYVEDVKDGFVYFTQGSAGNFDLSQFGYVHRLSIEDFAKDYSSIITKKQSN